MPHFWIGETLGKREGLADLLRPIPQNDLARFRCRARATAQFPAGGADSQIPDSAPSASEISRPITENKVVGSLVRAMQKSGLPIAERPNLLLWAAAGRTASSGLTKS